MSQQLGTTGEAVAPHDESPAPTELEEWSENDFMQIAYDLHKGFSVPDQDWDQLETFRAKATYLVDEIRTRQAFARAVNKKYTITQGMEQILKFHEVWKTITSGNSAANITAESTGRIQRDYHQQQVFLLQTDVPSYYTGFQKAVPN